MSAISLLSPVVEPAGEAKGRSGGRMVRCAGDGGCSAAMAVGRQHQALPCLGADLVRMLFEYLQPEELAHCRAVCRLWYQVACEHSLQVHCFMQTYPAFHRRRLHQALAGDPVRHCLLAGAGMAWRESVWRLRWEAGMTRALSRNALFFLLTQQRRAQSCFSAEACHCVVHHQMCIDRVACSPDGCVLATSGLSPRAPGDANSSVSLWQCDQDGLQLLCSGQQEGVVSELIFSADSRSLRVLDSQGHWQIWCAAAQGGWQSVGSCLLCRDAVNKAELSPDGRCLAVNSLTELALYGKTGSESWQKQWSLVRQPFTPSWRRGLWRPVPGVMQFSEDGHHFLLVSDQRRLVLHSDGSGWREQVLEDACLVPSGGVFSPCGRWLALAGWKHTQDAMGRYQQVVTVDLWRFAARQGWQQTRCCTCVPGLFRIGEPSFPLAFDPAGRTLVFPQRQGAHESSLSLVSVDSQPGQAAPLLLPLRASAAACSLRLSCVLRRLEFSANSRFLVAMAQAGVFIWQRKAVQDWVSVAQIANTGLSLPAGIQMALSPDGFHCALAMGDSGEVSIWGPEDGGRYVQKVQLRQGVPVGQLLFTTDASRLVISSSGCGEDGIQVSQLASLRLVPAIQGAKPGQTKDIQQAGIRKPVHSL